MVKVKLLVLILITLVIGGCQNKKNNYPEFNVQMFYSEDCGHCQVFKEKAIPALEKEFGDSMQVSYYNIDEKSSIDLYHDIIDQLYFYDQAFLEDVPFFVLENEFALLGYSTGEEKELIKDIKRALNNEALGSKLEAYRWRFNL